MLTCSGPNHKNIFANLEKDARNLLKANLEKFKTVFLCPAKAQDNLFSFIYISHFKIVHHQVTKPLDVLTEDKFKFDINVSDTGNEASKQIKALVRIRKFLIADDCLKSFIIAN